MKQKTLLFLAFSALMSSQLSAQGSSKMGYDFEKPVLVDSTSTLLIPTRYSADFLSSSKMTMWGDFYANILFYNFVTDSYKKLFEKDCYIVSFTKRQYGYYYNAEPKNENITSKLLFYVVHNVDHNKSGRVDHYDPAILYVSDLHGENLKALSTENESVVNLDFFEDQGFILVKMQRDADVDGDFEREDRDYYYVKLDLKTLTFGNKIETK